MEDRIKSTKPWLNAAALFSLGIGLLYIYGDTFWAGFLQEFSLSRYLFMESFEQTLVTGFRLMLRAPKENLKSLLIFCFAFFGIFGIVWITFWVVHKIRILLRLLFLVVVALGMASVLGIFFIFYNYALTQGLQSAQQFKRQMDAELNLKSEGRKLAKAIIRYSWHENKRPRQLMGYIIASSPNGFAIYGEGKVNFIPMSQIIQISYPVK